MSLSLSLSLLLNTKCGTIAASNIIEMQACAYAYNNNRIIVMLGNEKEKNFS
jgi:hypothetical protein